MELQIQDLVSSIKKDGIDSANQQAAAILADARKQADAIVADLKANGERVERLLVDGFSESEKAALRDYVSRMRANIDRAQHQFEHQTLPQSPVVMAPDQDGAEVANTKEENE